MKNFLTVILTPLILTTAASASMFSEDDERRFEQLRAEMNSLEGRATFQRLRDDMNRERLNPNGFFQRAQPERQAASRPAQAKPR